MSSMLTSREERAKRRGLTTPTGSPDTKRKKGSTTKPAQVPEAVESPPQSPPPSLPSTLEVPAAKPSLLNPDNTEELVALFASYGVLAGRTYPISVMVGETRKDKIEVKMTTNKVTRTLAAIVVCYR